jgi:hypothetical protein
MVDLNRTISSENSNLQDCVNLLEADLSQSLEEFKKLIQDFKEKNPSIGGADLIQ